MSSIPISEKCSCGATFAATGSTWRSSANGGTNGQHRGVEEMVERWRTDHKHEFPPASPIARRPIRMHQTQGIRS